MVPAEGIEPPTFSFKKTARNPRLVFAVYHLTDAA
jgi:hypothetical protein